MMILNLIDREKPLLIARVCNEPMVCNVNRTAPFSLSWYRWLSMKASCVLDLLKFFGYHTLWNSMPATHGGISRLRYQCACVCVCVCTWSVYIDDYSDGGNHILHLLQSMARFVYSGAGTTHIPIALACGTNSGKEFHCIQLWIGARECAVIAYWNTMGRHSWKNQIGIRILEFLNLGSEIWLKFGG